MRFTIKSSEGLNIRGNLEVPRAARALVILVHGFKGFKDWGFFPWLAEVLCDQSLAVCRFNMSRSGISENSDTFDQLELFADDTYSGQLDDLQRVVRYAQTRLALPTFLAGYSRGGGVALLGAADVPNLRAVVTWSSIARANRWDDATRQQWRKDGHIDVVNTRTKQIMRMSTRMLDDFEANHQRFDILGAASRLTVPLLAVHGGNDESVPVAESAELLAAAADGSRVIISAATHTYNAIHPLVHVPRELMIAADVTARFIGAYS
jgi:pimeloyl-ACP methyl ester carboxylesterase